MASVSSEPVRPRRCPTSDMSVRRALLCLSLAASAATASAAVSGRVVASDGHPLAGIAVASYALETIETRAERIMAGQDRRALATTRSAADGSFRFEGGDAVVLLGVRADGFAPAAVVAVPAEPATLRLKPAPMRRGTLMASGRPVAEATLAWLASWQDPQSAEMIVHSAKDGAYEVPDPDQWASGVAVVHRDFALALVTAEPKWGSRLSQELVAGVSLAGQVVDERSGRGGRRPRQRPRPLSHRHFGRARPVQARAPPGTLSSSRQRSGLRVGGCRGRRGRADRPPQEPRRRP